MEIKKCSVKEYYQIAERGIFDNARVELIEGEIVAKPSLTPPEAVTISLTNDALQKTFGKNFVCNIRLPLRLGKFSEPEPEIYVRKGKVRDFINSHPRTAELTVEVSEQISDYFRNRKASLYAKFAIKEYWIVNIKDRCLEIRRCPIEDKTAFYGFRYTEILIFTEKDEVSPLAAPEAKIKVADLLP
ncbi:Uma2 family endonuclease [soil metagenome]